MRHCSLKAVCSVLVVSAFAYSTRPVIADPTTSPAASQPATTGTSIIVPWDQASSHVGETVTVTGPVMGTHVITGGTALVLNVGKDYPDASRFTIMIKTDDKNPASADTYQGKTVTVTGKIELYRKVAEIKASPADVTVAK